MLFIRLKRARLAVILAALLLTVSSGATAHASFQYINNYTIRESIDASGSDTSTFRYYITSETPRKIADDSTFDFGSSDIYCLNNIVVSGGRYTHNYQLSTGDGGCKEQTYEYIDYVNPVPGLEYYFYQSDSTTIKSLMPGKSDTFKKVTYALKATDGTTVSGSRIYVRQSGGTCPALLLSNNGIDWRFMAPPTVTNGVTTTDDESLVYKDIVRAAGYTGVDLCSASNSGNSLREHSEDMLAELIGGNNSFWGSSTEFWGSGSNNTSWYTLASDGVKKIGRAVGTRDAAIVVLGEAEEGSTGSGFTGVGEGEDATSTCGVDDVGWFVCPAMNFIGKLNDMAFTFLSSNFLEVESAVVNDDATLAAWKNFRDIANALFIIAFLFMVYSQMAGGRQK